MSMLASVLESWIKVCQYEASAIDIKVCKSSNDMIYVSLNFPVSEMVSNLGHYLDFTVCGIIQPCHCQRQLE